MSSKLLDPERVGEAQPMVWRNIGREPAGVSQPAAQSSQTPKGPAQQQDRIQEVEREMEQRTKQAHQQGYAAGQAAGAQQASQELEPVLARIARSIEELSALRRKIRGEVEEDAVRLAIAVSRKIMYREITVDADALLGLVKAAFQRVDAREIQRLRVHPDDAAGLQRNLHADGMPSRLEISADPSLERGAVILETTRGNLDASIGTQLQEIERGFLDVVKRNRHV